MSKDESKGLPDERRQPRSGGGSRADRAERLRKAEADRSAAQGEDRAAPAPADGKRTG